MTNANDPDPLDVGEPDEAERAEEQLAPPGAENEEKPEEERAEEELEQLEGGAETMADLDDEERPHHGGEPRLPPE